MLEGIGKIKQKTQELEDIVGKDRIIALGLQDGESVVLRFLTDTDGIIKDKIHEVEEMSPMGKSWRKYRCTKDDTGICQYCSKGETPTWILYLWSYVYYVLHTTQNPKLNDNPDADKWAPVKVGSHTMYKEDVNSPRVFRSKLGGRDKVIEKAFIEFADEYGTWCDRDYKWARKGKSLDTTYILMPKDKSEMSDEIKIVKESLPKLSDYVLGKVRFFDQEGEIEEEIEEKSKKIFTKKQQESKEEEGDLF